MAHNAADGFPPSCAIHDLFAHTSCVQWADAAGHMGSVAHLRSVEQIEPATPPASLQRDDDACEPAFPKVSSFAWEGYPKVISYRMRDSKHSLARQLLVAIFCVTKTPRPLYACIFVFLAQVIGDSCK